ncbi:MAG: molybdopterin molybdotransferase MoeA, partial [Pseudomonadota bacterium]|nr:molybdopterin molybdotransferase MoeA [Pseudomonadota bacterium]
MIGAPSIGELSVEDARTRMLAAVPPLRTETIPLDTAALGRTLAEPITAVRDQPPFDASAMDGWAVARDAAPGVFGIVGESAAGKPFSGTLATDQAVRIFTGAEVPAGSRVVVQEASERVEGGVRLAFAADAPAYVRRRGGDFAAGATLLSTGVRLDPWRLALAASAGRAEARVTICPRVAILPTGEEIVPAGAPVRPDQIFDSGGPALAALVANWGGIATRHAPAGDSEAAILACVSAADCDLLVTVGGASVGDHDLVKPALSGLGLRLLVDTVRMRPGKPVWFGMLDDGRRVLGLPGNPASALVCAELFLRPLMMAWQGANPALPMETARLAAPLPKGGPREHWMRGALSTQDGALTCEAFPDQESSLVSVFARADCLIRRPIGA